MQPPHLYTKRLFVIDDERLTTDFVCKVARHKGYMATGINDADNLPIELSTLKPQDTLMIDLLMPKVDGIKLLRMLAESNCEANIILMSGQGRRILEKTLSQGINYGLNITGILPKPFYFSDVEKAFANIDMLSSDPVKRKNLNTDSKHSFHITLDAIHDAMKNHEFVPYFQPKVNLEKNELCGFEVLARWESPTEGIIPPYYFIEMIERDSICLEFTLDIIRQSLEILSIKQLDTPSLKVSFNIPPSILNDDMLPEVMDSLISRYNILRENIVFEITERSIPNKLNIAVEIINRLALLGYKISIDDFGTGHSSLEKIRDLMIHELKIDRSFIANLFQQDTHAIVRNAITLAESLELDIIAEGVENESQLNELRMLGIKFAQGYFFGKPMNADHLEDFNFSHSIQ